MISLFSRKKAACKKGDCAEQAVVTTQHGSFSDVVPVRRSQKADGEFDIEIGHTEKHLLVGKLSVQSEMRLDVFGITGGGTLRFSKQGQTEVYDGDVGVREKLYIKVEREPGRLPRSRSKVRLSINGRLAQSFEVRPKLTAHYVVFQHVMPCLFVLITAYYAFVFRPDVALFYTAILSGPNAPRKAPARPGTPTLSAKQQQLARCIPSADAA